MFLTFSIDVDHLTDCCMIHLPTMNLCNTCFPAHFFLLQFYLAKKNLQLPFQADTHRHMSPCSNRRRTKVWELNGGPASAAFRLSSSVSNLLSAMSVLSVSGTKNLHKYATNVRCKKPAQVFFCTVICPGPDAWPLWHSRLTVAQSKPLEFLQKFFIP